MIIGIAGKKQHGKDTVAKMLQYLGTTVKHSYAFEDFINPNVNYPLENSNDALSVNYGSKWEIHRFADAPKDIMAIILNEFDFRRRWEANHNNYRDEELGEEWDRFEVFFTDNNNVKHMVLLFDSLEEAEAYWTTCSGSVKFGYGKTKMTRRLLIQYLATDGCRYRVHPNIWINTTMSNYKLSREVKGKGVFSQQHNRFVVPAGHGEHSGRYLTKPDFVYHLEEPRYPYWIIPDIRFPNEANAVKNKGGIVIKVERTFYKNDNDTHDSETALDAGFNYDWVIPNSGTINDLLAQVSIMVRELNILI
jgi:hypothetical protein